MDDIEALCTRVMVIGEGSILSGGSIDDLRRRVSRERLLIVDLEQEGEAVTDDHAKVVRYEGRRPELRFKPEDTSAADLIRRVTAQHAVQDLFVENPPIEEIIAQMHKERRPRGPIAASFSLDCRPNYNTGLRLCLVSVPSCSGNCPDDDLRRFLPIDNRGYANDPTSGCRICVAGTSIPGAHRMER